ncbi:MULTISPECIES: hypothetical protein [Xanthomonas]|uniref:hypothetical protein n=1 Tax=Xanthomonas TaxID=338 RepID=UPI001D04E377|nr:MULTISPECIES: hypothetical protein [Xanthomonas]
MFYPKNCRLRSLCVLLSASMALVTSCSSAAPTAKAPSFAGAWGYAKKCDSGHFLAITLEQRGNHVTGDWSEGTNLRGGGGKLEGEVREAKLYVRYCSDDGEAGYAVCPAFSGVEDYFALEKGALVRYQKSGPRYERDVALHPSSKGHQVPFDTKCMEEEP